MNSGNDEFFNKVRVFYQKTEFPKDFGFYNYPFLVYLKYWGQNKDDIVKFEKIIEDIPSILDDNRDHFPLFSRYWYYAIEYLSRDTLENEAAYFLGNFEEDGGIKILYQNLPWWRPIFSLDGLIFLKKYKLIK